MFNRMHLNSGLRTMNEMEYDGNDDNSWRETVKNDGAFAIDCNDSIYSTLETSPSPITADPMRGLSLGYRRIRNRRRIYAPRVVKNDVRRHYASMLANVYNSLDYDLLSSFLTAFAEPSMRVRKSTLLRLPTSKSFRDSFRRSVMRDTGSSGGLKWSMIYFSVIKSLCPDSTMRIISSQLLTRSDTSKTWLIMTVRFDFARFHDVDPLLFMDDMFETSAKQTSKKRFLDVFSSNADSAAECYLPPDDVDPFDYYKQKVGSEIPLLCAPQQFSFTINVQVCINEYKRVEVIDLSQTVNA